MKRRFSWVLLAFITLAFTTACAVSRPPTAITPTPLTGSANDAPTLAPSPFPSATHTLKNKATAHGLTIEIHDVQWKGNWLRIDLCYPFPDQNHQWTLTNTPEDVFVKIGTHKYLVDNFGLLAWKQGPRGQKIRCDAAYFPVPQEIETQNLTTAQLHITALSRELPEEINCGEVNAALKSSGIQITCPPNGGYRISKKPAEMSNEEAFRKIAAAIAPRFEGPWVITFQLP